MLRVKQMVIIKSPWPTGWSDDLKLYPWTFFFSFIYQSTSLCSHAVDGHQMYLGGSVVGKA